MSNEHGVPFTLRSAGDDVTLNPTEKYRYERENEPAGKRNGKRKVELGFQVQKPQGKRLWSIYETAFTRFVFNK